MCTPQLSAVAASVGKKRDDMTIEGTDLGNLKKAPRQLSLTTRAQFAPLPGIALGGITDISRQTQGAT